MKQAMLAALILLTLTGIHLMNKLPSDNPTILGDQTTSATKENSQFAINNNPAKPNLLPLEFQKQIANDPNAILIDIREPHEIAQGKIKGALEIDFYSQDFQNQINQLDRSKNYYIYCNSGNRTSQTLPLMQSLGFTKVTHLSTGIQGWYQQSLQTCTNC